MFTEGLVEEVWCGTEDDLLTGAWEWTLEGSSIR